MTNNDKPRKNTPRSTPRDPQRDTPRGADAQTSTATILVRAPEGVRAVAALLLGLGVSAMVMPLATTWQVIVLVVAIAAGFLLTFSHPYRKKVRAAVEATGRKYKTSVAQILPLFPLWLGLMILPAFQIHSWIATLVVLAIAGGYAWMAFPSIDGTRYLAEPGTGQVQDA